MIFSGQFAVHNNEEGAQPMSTGLTKDTKEEAVFFLHLAVFLFVLLPIGAALIGIRAGWDRFYDVVWR